MDVRLQFRHPVVIPPYGATRFGNSLLTLVDPFINTGIYESNRKISFTLTIAFIFEIVTSTLGEFFFFFFSPDLRIKCSRVPRVESKKTQAFKIKISSPHVCTRNDRPRIKDLPFLLLVHIP